MWIYLPNARTNSLLHDIVVHVFKLAMARATHLADPLLLEKFLSLACKLLEYLMFDQKFHVFVFQFLIESCETCLIFFFIRARWLDLLKFFFFLNRLKILAINQLVGLFICDHAILWWVSLPNLSFSSGYKSFVHWLVVAGLDTISLTAGATLVGLIFIRFLRNCFYQLDLDGLDHVVDEPPSFFEAYNFTV